MAPKLHFLIHVHLKHIWPQLRRYSMWCRQQKPWAIRLKVSFRSLPLAVCENYKCSASPIRNSCKQVYAVFKLWRSKRSSKSQQALRSYWAKRNENRALTVTTTHVAHKWRVPALVKYSPHREVFLTQCSSRCLCKGVTVRRSVLYLCSTDNCCCRPQKPNFIEMGSLAAKKEHVSWHMGIHFWPCCSHELRTDELRKWRLY